MSEIEENIEENFDNYICQFTQKRNCLDEVNDNDEDSENKSNANKRKQKKNDNDEVSQLLL